MYEIRCSGKDSTMMKYTLYLTFNFCNAKKRCDGNKANLKRANGAVYSLCINLIIKQCRHRYF